MRPIAPLSLAADIQPAAISSAPPEFRLLAPASLRVDPKYQRDLGQRSIALIERIVKEWDWRAFKPPVVVASADGWDVIDGQHTAIAAATHPGISEIPVMVVQADAIEDRANAFVRHNRDRIAVSALELHFAQLAAGDETAQTIAKVCERAGVKLLRLPPSMGRFKVGDCMAINAIRGLVNRRHAMGARVVLETAVKGQAKPVSKTLIRAIERLLHDPEYQGEIAAEDIVSVLLTGHDLDKETGRFATERKLPLFQAMASIIFMKRKARRRG